MRVAFLYTRGTASSTRNSHSGSVSMVYSILCSVVRIDIAVIILGVFNCGSSGDGGNIQIKRKTR